MCQVAKEHALEGIALPITLGPDEYFVLGDNSAESTDSRHFGPVSREAIQGKVMRIVFPPWRIREL
jgi:signal peptidase I